MKIIRKIKIALIIFTAASAIGCGKSQSTTPKSESSSIRVSTQKWKPSAIGGPLEVRPLPPVDAVLKDYSKWIADGTTKARIYEIKMDDKEKQFDYSVEYRNENSPLGSAEHTYVKYFYKDEKGMAYQFSWHTLGHHPGTFMQLNGQPKIVWGMLNRQASSTNKPLLQVVAFEGVDLGDVVIAEP